MTRPAGGIGHGGAELRAGGWLDYWIAGWGRNGDTEVEKAESGNLLETSRMRDSTGINDSTIQ